MTLAKCPPAEVPCATVDAIFAALGIDESFLDESTDKATNESTPEGRPWVLHVEDDRELSAALQARLEAHGISVVRAHDGTSGVRTALGRQASAIILDYELPNGQGDYVLARLKSNPITNRIPVIILTGMRDRHLQRRLLGMGAARFFNKPVDFAKLLEELKSHVAIGT